MNCGMPGFPVLHYLPEFAQTHFHWVGDAIQLSHPILLLPSSGQSIGASASAPALPMNIQGWFPLGLSGLISLLTKELLSLLQHHSLKGTVLQCSAFFMAQLLHPYMSTGKTIALTILTFVGKVMSLLLNMLSVFVIAFLPRNKSLLISWLESLSTVIWSPKKKVYNCFHFFSIYLPWSDRIGCHDLSFEYWILSQPFHYINTYMWNLKNLV